MKHKTLYKQTFFSFNWLIHFLCVNVTLIIASNTTMEQMMHNREITNTPTVSVNLAEGNSSTRVPPLIGTTSPPLRRQSPPRVRFNKCCPLGEDLDETQNCIVGSSLPWLPLVFLIQQRHYYQPAGESPRFMSFTPNMRPKQCNGTDLSLFRGNKIVLFSNGSLFLHERSLLIEPRSYCVDRESALVCLPEQHQHNNMLLKIKKCCGKHGSYDDKLKKCTFSTEPKTNGQLVLTPLNESSYQTVYGLPVCRQFAGSTSYAVAGDWSEAKLDLNTGYLVLPHKNLSSNDYCLEHLQAELRSSMANMVVLVPPVKIIACSHHFAPNLSRAVSLNGASNNKINNNNNDHQAAGQVLRVAALHTGIVISVVFLAATLIAGYMLPSIHHALHWRCQIYYVFCLFVGELLLAITLLTNWPMLGTAWCLFIASSMQFFFLSAFFWLNTMCFNIWWTFRDFRPSSLERNQESLRLRLYSAYAWGIPLLISAIATCVDQLPETQLLRPGFGEHQCWFNDERLSIFAYFFGPIGLLLCANIILFISTTHQLTCGLWKRDDVKSSSEKTALGKVCLKLVVVMGVTWIADVISWLVGGPHSVWFITDLINALQGVFIFIVVGCQPQVWAACKRICCPRLRHDITNTTNGVQHSSSSQGLPSMANCGTEFTQNTSMNISTHTTAATTPTSMTTIGTGGSIMSNGAIYVCSPAGINGQLSIMVKTPATASAQATQNKIPMETAC